MAESGIVDPGESIASVPPIILNAWKQYATGKKIQSVEDVSANVSTNTVYLLILDTGEHIIAKISHFGTYEQFVEDHQRIQSWSRLLESTRFNRFLAEPLALDGQVFVYHENQEWVIFYKENPRKHTLPRILTREQIAAFAREIANFHKLSGQIGDEVGGSSKSIRKDIRELSEILNESDFQRENRLSGDTVDYLKKQCDIFLNYLQEINYDTMLKIPLLVDWNIGNFSIDEDDEKLLLFSRWDYDWFRIEHPVLDLYFCSRVVSQIGDKTHFSYLADPLLEERFRFFLKNYMEIFPLNFNELTLLREAYRFFILNYVIKDGMKFFKPDIFFRLQQEALDKYLPELDKISSQKSFEKLIREDLL